MGQQQLREHWIASGLRGWLSDWLETQAAERLSWLQRLRLRWWSWKWPEHLHSFKLLSDMEGATEPRINFASSAENPTPLTWEEGSAPEGYTKRARRNER